MPPPAAVDAPPPLIERWESPRITIRADGWRFAQKEGGVSLAPDRIETLEVPADVPLTFEWSARPRTGQGEINGYRWALGIDDITDETPRSGPDDLSHWSAWSLTETSATVGPFIASTDTLVIRHFYVEARDDLGFLSLVTVRLVVQRALGGDPLLVTRR